MSTTTYTSSAALARAFVAALNSRDFVTLKAVLSSDVEFHFLPSSVGLPPAIGVEAAAGGIEQICKLIPDFTVSILYAPSALTQRPMSFPGHHQRSDRIGKQSLGLCTLTLFPRR
jgi:hypothetical protein